MIPSSQNENKEKGAMQLSSCDLKSDFTDYYDEFFTEEGDNLVIKVFDFSE